jgi:hypothetical protein
MIVTIRRIRVCPCRGASESAVDPAGTGIFTLQCAAMSLSTTAACPFWAASRIAVALFVVNARSTLQREAINCSSNIGKALRPLSDDAHDSLFSPNHELSWKRQSAPGTGFAICLKHSEIVWSLWSLLCLWRLEFSQH